MDTESSERNRLIGLARRTLGRGEGDSERLRALAGDLFNRVTSVDQVTVKADKEIETY